MSAAGALAAPDSQHEAARASTSTTPPSTPISTIARENSGPLFSSVAASTANTTISLMPARIPPIRNGSATISCDRKQARTAYSSSTR
jgi:hypothetical protein